MSNRAVKMITAGGPGVIWDRNRATVQQPM